MPSLPLTPPVFSILSGLIEDRSGLHYRPADKDLLADKISSRAIEAGFESLLDYYYFLRYDPGGSAELDELVEALCVHETYFFREADQLEVLVDELLLPAIAAGRRPRVWCAACATGEEPLTIAMMLASRGLLDKVELIASDLSERALSRARRGEFRRRSTRALPPGVADQWLSHDAGGRLVAHPSLERSIRWLRLNLIDADAIAKLGTFEVILCRNVLIYFRDSVVVAVVEQLARALVPGGCLLVGASESLLRFGTALVCDERRGAFFYRRAS